MFRKEKPADGASADRHGSLIAGDGVESERATGARGLDGLPVPPNTTARYTEFEPRLGAAWQAGRGIVVRVGYGIMHESLYGVLGPVRRSP